ncbi:MAG: M14 family zinc carboxypeptidase [Gammaproteobacteria bacterium]|nr:M14 family zinc carboxypeptidase [Gammaproteobacteria bacterium]MDP2142174.1 M14 family zinc carboxypeptidase [Gammaproteobacteria bacterium]MDP2348218.1 M14 family zinc carboxypeptidase [Gammaproteobacteria bacterium]
MSWKHPLILVCIALAACQVPVRDSAQVSENVSESALPAIAADTTAPAAEIVAPDIDFPTPIAETATTAAASDAIQTPPQDQALPAIAAENASTPSASEPPSVVVSEARSDKTPAMSTASARHPLIDSLCREIGGKLGSVTIEDCKAQDLQFSGSLSVNERALAFKDVLPPANQPVSRVMIIGGIHGDEYSSISIMFRWMEILQRTPSDFFHWRFLPAANPDGLLDGTAVRQNANGVDLNRNFPSGDWLLAAHDTWRKTTGSNPRRFPGHAPASEPETQWLVAQIEEFKPDVIVSVHAPYDLLDYDGPPEAPHKIGQLYLHQLGVYPGSLGNYGGINLGIPVVTLELPSAGIMPNRQNIQGMWDDLHTWLATHPTTLSRADFKHEPIAEQ